MELFPSRRPGALVLAPRGRIDHGNAEDFQAALRAPLAECRAGGARLVLDLSGLEYISSAGLRVLMLASRQATAQGGDIVVAAMAPVVREIFDISKFTLVFRCFETVDEALAC